MAYNWAITLLTISVALLLTTPQVLDHTERVFLYAAGTCLACLSLVTSVGLIYYSILSHPGAQLAKWLVFYLQIKMSRMHTNWTGTREELYKKCVTTIQGGLLLTSNNFGVVREAIEKAFANLDVRLSIWIANIDPQRTSNRQHNYGLDLLLLSIDEGIQFDINQMTRSGGFSLVGTFQSSLQQHQLHNTTTHSGELPFGTGSTQDLRSHGSDFFPSYDNYHSQIQNSGDLSIGLRPLNSPTPASGILFFPFIFGALLTYFASQKSRMLEKVDMEELASVASRIVCKEKCGYEITIVDPSDGYQVVDIIPPGPELLISEGESIKLDQPLTSILMWETLVREMQK
ncbi:hypothetical protein ZIOFF_033041 [Zingiber officinale]|uniref:Cytochrome f n=1 Tax=Zingiber officinale TaxID=94328 RepID=A0A8J5GPY0_ZINOF|nr:hypothetical protein ZIOFF_033041 [Zingiber officinale]